MDNMDNMELEQNQELPVDLLKNIEAKVAELKEANPSVRAIFPIVVEGEEYDTKPYFVAYFKRPAFKAFSKYLTFAQQDQTVAMRDLAKACFVDGDKELVDDDDLFIFGLMGQFAQIINIRHGKLVNLSKPGK